MIEKIKIYKMTFFCFRVETEKSHVFFIQFQVFLLQAPLYRLLG